MTEAEILQGDICALSAVVSIQQDTINLMLMTIDKLQKAVEILADSTTLGR